MVTASGQNLFLRLFVLVFMDMSRLLEVKQRVAGRLLSLMMLLVLLSQRPRQMSFRDGRGQPMTCCRSASVGKPQWCRGTGCCPWWSAGVSEERQLWMLFLVWEGCWIRCSGLPPGKGQGRGQGWGQGSVLLLALWVHESTIEDNHSTWFLPQWLIFQHLRSVSRREQRWERLTAQDPGSHGCIL